MSNGSRKSSFGQGVIGGLAAVVMLFFCGCGDFFAQKPSEIEAQSLLNEVKQVPKRPEATNPLPELYREPAKKLKTEKGVKLFYFTKHHPAEELAQLVQEQFAAEMKSDGKGNLFYIPKYAITPSAATNQLIVECPNDKEADTVLDFLKQVDVPPIQVNIDCMILERYADVTMDWETTIQIQNLLGENIEVGGKPDLSGPKDEFGNYPLLPAFPGASLRQAKRSTFGLDIGYWKNRGVSGHQLRAMVDMLVSRGYLKVLMNPNLETVNGQPAKITSRENVPIEKMVSTPSQNILPYSITEYQWVEDTLEVTPHVYADGSIGLKTKAQIGSKSKPEGVVQASIITERSVDVAENRIKPGDSLVIGGIKKTEQRAVVRGVPFLKDIPLLGVLFSSKDYQEEGTEVIFILTPSISSGGVKYADMVDKVRKKLKSPAYKGGLEGVVTDPFGVAAYTKHVEQQASEAEFEKFKAQTRHAKALEDVALVKERLYKTAEQVLAEKSKSAKARSELEKFRQEVEKLKAEAVAERTKADAAKKELAEAQGKLAEAEQERTKSAEAQKRLEEAEKARKKLELETEKAKKEAEELRKQLEKAEKSGRQAGQGSEQSGQGSTGVEKQGQDEGAAGSEANEPADGGAESREAGP